MSHQPHRDRLRHQGMIPVLEAALEAGAGLLRHALTAADQAIASWLHWHRAGCTIEWLLTLDDTRLKAMGLERSEIVAAVYQTAQAEWERQRRPGTR